MSQWEPAQRKLPVVCYLRTLQARLNEITNLVLRRDIERLETLKKIMEMKRG